MKTYSLAVIMAAILVMGLFAAPGFCQDAANAPEAAPAVEPKEEAAGPKDLSIYGEVQAVNTTANSLSVQYYNYDSDEEKTIELVLNNNTKLENAASLANIKKGDWVDATYSLEGGKNIAKSIVVEKEEIATEEATPQKAAANTETPAEE